MMLRRSHTAACFLIAWHTALAAIVVAQPGAGPASTDRPIRYQAFRAIQPTDENNTYRGSAICSGCHSGLGNFPAGVLGRVCMSEFNTWQFADRHSQAYASLLGERGQAIGKRLNMSVTDEETGCVQCHSMATELPFGTEFDQQNRRANLAKEGVSCEACHGPSSQWIGPHSDYLAYPAWQQKSVEEKTGLGWFDVRSPVTRAELCLSCHLSSERYNRRITHAMYAAGHPPLAGFEIESFIDKMPRHWRYPYEKADNPDMSFGRTRNLLVASVVAMRMAVEAAVADATSLPDSARWPELARLDCFACHHQLEFQNVGWRQLRQAPVLPGRPQLALGCLPLVKVAVEVTGDSQMAAQLNATIERLREPFRASPFAEPNALAERSASVIEWCDELERRLAGDATVIDISANSGRDFARRVLNAIANQATTDSHDYDTARQLFGAWIVVYRELRENGALQLPATSQTELTSILDQLAQRDPFLLERQRAISPCNPDGTQLVVHSERSKPKTETALLKSFRARTQYDPAWFADRLVRLKRLTND
jgi:cytochrome c554/c'-like protein